MDLLIVLFIAVIVDAIWGDDHLVWRKFKHPVILAGRFINFLDVSLTAMSSPSHHVHLMVLL